MKTYERIQSAIRSIENEDETFVVGESGRVYLVRGYRKERERAASEPGMMRFTPMLGNVEIVRDSTMY